MTQPWTPHPSPRPPAGLVPLPMDFRSKLCLLLFINLGVSWLVDSFGSWLFERLKGRRVCGVTVA